MMLGSPAGPGMAGPGSAALDREPAVRAWPAKLGLR